MASAPTRPTGWGDPPVRSPEAAEVRAAAARIAGTVVRTPLLPLSRDIAPDVWLKPEVLQPTGSFKVRGVLNWSRSLPPEARSRGFSTFSAGNTALALAYAARECGASCRSLLPDYAPRSKVDALRRSGVETVLMPFARMAEWLFRAGWREEPYAFLHPWTEPLMVAGHATIGLELTSDLPGVNTVFVPVGGGALAAGVGSVLKGLVPGVRVVGVQTESYPSLQASLNAGRPVWVEPAPTVCDGVAVPFTTDQMFPLLRRVVDDVMVVTEQAVKRVMAMLAVEAKLVVEGAGALALAAALDTPPGERGQTVCLVTGGSIGASELADVLAAR